MTASVSRKDVIGYVNTFILGTNIGICPGGLPAGIWHYIPANHYPFHSCGAPLPERLLLTSTGSYALAVDPSFSGGPARGRGWAQSWRQARGLGIWRSPPVVISGSPCRHELGPGGFRGSPVSHRMNLWPPVGGQSWAVPRRWRKHLMMRQPRPPHADQLMGSHPVNWPPS
jgi:hypothetical protein